MDKSDLTDSQMLVIFAQVTKMIEVNTSQHLTYCLQASDKKAELQAALSKIDFDLKEKEKTFANSIFKLIERVGREPSTIDEIKPIPLGRVFVDGCFDLCHCGHFNAIRQASLVADELVVGVNSDADIMKSKGPTVLNSKERTAIIESCRFATQIIPDTPYYVNPEILDGYSCQFYAHGDDPVITPEGTDMCQMLKGLDRFKMLKRTTGVSTTDITGRLLRILSPDSNKDEAKEAPKQVFLQTASRIRNFTSKI